MKLIWQTLGAQLYSIHLIHNAWITAHNLSVYKSKIDEIAIQNHINFISEELPMIDLVILT